MLLSKTDVRIWLEFTRIVRVEIMLDKMEVMLAGLDIERTHWLWLQWEQMTEFNSHCLTALMVEVDRQRYSEFPISGLEG